MSPETPWIQNTHVPRGLFKKTHPVYLTKRYINYSTHKKLARHLTARINILLRDVFRAFLFFLLPDNRWEVIANYMNLHSTTGIKRTAKDVINKAKSLQKLGIFIFVRWSACFHLLPSKFSLHSASLNTFLSIPAHFHYLPQF